MSSRTREWPQRHRATPGRSAVPPTGLYERLGVIPVTFDRNQAGIAGNPVATPWHAPNGWAVVTSDRAWRHADPVFAPFRGIHGSRSWAREQRVRSPERIAPGNGQPPTKASTRSSSCSRGRGGRLSPTPRRRRDHSHVTRPARRRQELPLGADRQGLRLRHRRRARLAAGPFGGRSQLIVYHAMYAPSWNAGCPSCSSMADGVEGIRVHLENHDLAFTAGLPGAARPAAGSQAVHGVHLPVGLVVRFRLQRRFRRVLHRGPAGDRGAPTTSARSTFRRRASTRDPTPTWTRPSRRA